MSGRHFTPTGFAPLGPQVKAFEKDMSGWVGTIRVVVGLHEIVPWFREAEGVSVREEMPLCK
jgi:hypothetical protein